MTKRADKDKYIASCKLLDEGKYVEAVKMAESISSAPFRAGIFIDGGFALGDSSKVRKGTRIFEEMLLTDKSKYGIARRSIAYNAANGYSSLYSLKLRTGKNITSTNDIDLRNAKKLYRLAIEDLEDTSPAF